jgi:hypothetical protein
VGRLCGHWQDLRAAVCRSPLKYVSEENFMQSTIGSINLDDLFKTLWQAQQDYLTEAVK